MLPYEKELAVLKYLSTYLALWEIPDEVLNYIVEAFGSYLPELWTESFN